MTCSLGYLPDLPGTRTYCRPDQLIHPLAPTKQNVVCDGRSAYDVITGSEDYRLVGAPRHAGSSNGGSGFNITSHSPLVEVVVEPEERIVLILESTASMNEDDDWKWIAKVAHKIIRYNTLYIFSTLYADTVVVIFKFLFIYDKNN